MLQSLPITKQTQGAVMSSLQMSNRYLPDEDRMLLLIGTPAQEEYRLLFTRRMTKELLSALQKVIDIESESSTPSATGQSSPVTANNPLNLQAATKQFRHQQAVAHGDFKKKYQAEGKKHPLGDQPILVIGFSISQQTEDNQGFGLTLKMANGKELNMSATSDVLHCMHKLFADSIINAEWDIDIALFASDNRPDQLN